MDIVERKPNLVLSPSAWALMASNAIVILVAVRNGWQAIDFLWMYWFQLLIIGFFVAIKLKLAYPGSFPAKSFWGPKFRAFTKSSSNAFLLVFYFINILYGLWMLWFLYFSPELSCGIECLRYYDIAIMSVMLFLNHLFSFLYNKSHDFSPGNILRLEKYTLTRVSMLQAILILGLFMFSIEETAIIMIVIFKVSIDLWMHMVEHDLLRKGQAVVG